MPKIKNRNLFEDLSATRKREVFQTLYKSKGVKIERIGSLGRATPEGKWLSSKKAEWVIVLRGRARLLFKHGSRKLDLKAEDHVFIPAQARHRVDWTHPKQKTVWLAVHISPDIG
jgi:cupin 2 domain-containing protein